MKPSFVLTSLALFSGHCLADPLQDRQDENDLIHGFMQLPQCGQQCLLSSIPQSVCQTVTNTTCLCTNQPFFHLVQSCVTTACNGTDSLKIAKIYSDACELPARNQRPQLLAVLSIELLGAIAVILRLYSRWKYAPRYEIDDWIMVFCIPLFIVFLALGHYVGNLAFGVDVWTVDPYTLVYALKLFYVDESFYITILALTKISVLFFLLRIFPQRGFRCACYGVMAWVATSGLVFLLLQINQCRPVQYVWEGWLGNFGPHYCINVNALAYTAGAFSIAQDFAILVLPLPLLWKLNMAWKYKAEIVVTMSLGIFILITSVTRLAFIVEFAASSNPTWDYTAPSIWSGLEVGVSMIVTSLPAIRCLLADVMPSAFASRISRDKKTPNGTATIGSNRQGFLNKQGKSWSALSSKGDHPSESEVELDLRRGSKTEV